jgi:hypothetical protein
MRGHGHSSQCKDCSSLLAPQARHPTTTIAAYLDDTYHLDRPAAAVAAMRSGTECTERLCGVRSNLAKQEAFSPAGDLSVVPAYIRGSTAAQADGSAGELLATIKVLGSFIGDETEASARLVARVEKTLVPLARVVALHDTRNHEIAGRVQWALLRFCANTSLTFFLRAMPLGATRAAAARHDELIAAAFHDIACSHPAGPLRRDLALKQARLPVKMGGMGLTSMVSISPAAVVGTWTLCWETLQRLCPQVVRGIDLGGPPNDLPPSLAELAGTRAELVEQHAAVASQYAAASKCVCHDKHGAGYAVSHPFGLPETETLLPLSEYGSESEHLQHAQRRYSSIVHHSAWEEVRTAWARVSQREAVRFVGVGQSGERRSVPLRGADAAHVPHPHTRHAHMRAASPRAPALGVCRHRGGGLGSRGAAGSAFRPARRRGPELGRARPLAPTLFSPQRHCRHCQGGCGRDGGGARAGAVQTL